MVVDRNPCQYQYRVVVPRGVNFFFDVYDYDFALKFLLAAIDPVKKPYINRSLN